MGYPVISVDTKKKEAIGEYSRPSDSLYGKEAQITLDHDFKTADSHTAVPHGIYDVKENAGYITIGTSSDTGEFVCDNIKNRWLKIGILLYPFAKYLLILCDGGGSNSSRHYIFKEELQKLVNEINIEIRVAHYPPYCSKYNPIEHRMFPHVTQVCKGVVFKSVGLVKKLIEKAKTNKGLKVVANVMNKLYETGKKVKEGFKENMKIIFDKILPKWNYRVIPEKRNREVIYLSLM